MTAEFHGKVQASRFPGYLVIEAEHIRTRTILDRWIAPTEVRRADAPSLLLRDRPLSTALSFRNPGMAFDQELFVSAPCTLGQALDAHGWAYTRV